MDCDLALVCVYLCVWCVHLDTSQYCKLTTLSRSTPRKRENDTVQTCVNGVLSKEANPKETPNQVVSGKSINQIDGPTFPIGTIQKIILRILLFFDDTL